MYILGDIRLGEDANILLAGTFFTGAMCSLLGIGGGELLGPLFLAFGILPPVSTATTSMMSLLTTANNVLHYAITGEPSLALLPFRSNLI